MRILVHADAARLFRWHLVLAELLSADGHTVTVSFEDRREPLPVSLTALFDYDRARSGATPDRFSTHIKAQDLSRFAGSDTSQSGDIALDLATASFVANRPVRTLRPLYDGSYKDYALFHALLERRAPHLAVADSSAQDHVWGIGLPAIETPWRIGASFDQVVSRLVDGLRKTIAELATGAAPESERLAARPSVSTASIFSSAGTFAAARAARKFARAGEKLSGETPKWHVAWRRIAGSGTPVSETLKLEDFQTLPDDGRRFFADPFLFVHEGQRHVFVEELPQETGRGIVSHFSLDENGKATKPQPVLETSYHLSYPFVFGHAGEIWMLPEASAAGGLDLFRAERFPDRWTKVARLIEGRVHDATLFQRGGKFWIAAGSESLQSATWDALSLFYADNLMGPWRAHVQNPVLVDARAARPAGALWLASDGGLVRPAQDCSEAYGGRLTLRKVTELSGTRFAEETIGTIAFESQEILGPHTLSRGGGFEVIDFFASPRALKGRRGAGS